MPEGVLVSALRLPLLFRGDIMRPSSLLAVAFAAPVLLVVLHLRVRSGMRLSTASLWAVLGIYTAWAAGLLFGVASGSSLEDGRWINLVPFATIAAQVQQMSGSSVVQLVGNLGLLLPLGLIGPVVMPALRRPSRLVQVALGVAAAIELVQLVGTTAGLFERSVDVDDLILNVTGALLGWGLWRLMASIRMFRPGTLDPGESRS